jgi:tRNA dimethylallyltransferase
MKSADTIDCPVIVLVGPTAIGKTALSLQLVQRFDCEIVSMDSMQVYRYMDIGTAKPDPEEQARVPHHLLDIINPDEQYDAARFVRDALAAIRDIASRRRTVLLTGGTGLYLKALLEGLFSAMPADQEIRRLLQQRLTEEGRDVLHAELSRIDPVSGAKIHKNDSQRLIRGLEIYLTSGKTWSALLREQQRAGEQNRVQQFSRIFQIALNCDREELYQRIEERSSIMLKQGLVEEVEKLLAMGYSADLPSMQSIGYRHVNNLLANIWNRQEMIEHLVRDTRRYAKRQLTWFSRQQGLNWFDRDNQDRVGDRIAAELNL